MLVVGFVSGTSDPTRSPLNRIAEMEMKRVNICQNIWSLFGGVGVNRFEGVGMLSGLVDGLKTVCGTNGK